MPGTAEHSETPLPGRTAAALRARASAFGVPVAAVLLAAHAKVLSALSADAEVTTGYLVPGTRRPTACRLTVGPGTWRHLVEEAHRVLSLPPPRSGTPTGSPAHRPTSSSTRPGTDARRTARPCA